MAWDMDKDSKDLRPQGNPWLDAEMSASHLKGPGLNHWWITGIFFFYSTK